MGEQMERRSVQIDAQIEKNTVAIRDLIVVSRALLDAQQTNEKRMERLHSEMERLHSDIKAEIELLAKELRAFLKGFQKPNGNQ
jgi:hypothetical protein